VGLTLIHDGRFPSDFDEFAESAGFHFDVGGGGLADHDFDVRDEGGETRLGGGNGVRADGQELKTVRTGVAGSGRTSQCSGFALGDYLSASDSGAGLIGNGAFNRGGSSCLSVNTRREER